MTAIVVNHLTRMAEPRICVAGIDFDRREHVRPVTPREEPLTREALAAAGGPFELGALVELGETSPAPDPPFVEDHRFELTRAERVMRLSGEEYLELVDGACAQSLAEAFGPELKPRERTWAARKGAGERSLACIRAPARSRLRYEAEGDQVRFYLDDSEHPSSIRVSDIRFFALDSPRERERAVADVIARMRRGVPAWVMLGLGRAWRAGTDRRKRHWLHVNSVCLEDRPLGELP